MSIPRYYTVGAVAGDLQSLKSLDGRLEASGLADDSLLVLTRRRDERVVRATLPGARTRPVESGLTRLQWFEFASMFLAVTATSVLMGAIHLWTGLVVEALLVIGSVVGLTLYYRQPRLGRKLLELGLPERFAREWEGLFSSGFALVLATVPAEDFDAAQEAFLADAGLDAPLAVDRRPVF